MRVAPTMEQVLPAVLRCERTSVVRTRTLLVSGSLLSLFGPLCVATFMWLGFARGSNQMSWGICFAIAVLIVVPLVFGIERWTRGSFLENSAEHFTNSGSWFATGIAGRGLLGVVVVEIWLWGPRMVFAAWDRFGKSQSGAGVDRKVAAAILCKLLAQEGGLPAVEVLEGIGETESVPALAFLLCYDWVGISKDGSRIWLDSTARKWLEPVTGSSPSA
ncbi:MAG TPA: hypothetical protein VG269_13320 [Tepidisphaeraceae bacterium]|jgi:hypothetical protein|nr:hypothetical protein [Tepidisphaeraceae bacterium]